MFGFLANKFRSIRAITFAACVTYVGGNVIYSTLSLFPYDARYYMLLVCRFMVGISTGMLRRPTEMELVTTCRNRFTEIDLSK